MSFITEYEPYFIKETYQISVQPYQYSGLVRIKLPTGVELIKVSIPFKKEKNNVVSFKIKKYTVIDIFLLSHTLGKKEFRGKHFSEKKWHYFSEKISFHEKPYFAKQAECAHSFAREYKFYGTPGENVKFSFNKEDFLEFVDVKKIILNNKELLQIKDDFFYQSENRTLLFSKLKTVLHPGDVLQYFVTYIGKKEGDHKHTFFVKYKDIDALHVLDEEGTIVYK